MLSAQARLRRQRLGEKNPPSLRCIPHGCVPWDVASSFGIAHLMGNLHATAQINLSCELHESPYDRFMHVGLGLKLTPS